ncbi:hypothetical protein [Nocardia paucivorans]|uniref:hypothetical protein n=1 Tax=Nocardia paucivorans TaxID=114259 RepID=UPI000592CF2B|nr:hypothetical protein [Nocardia paucivorans]
MPSIPASGIHRAQPVVCDIERSRRFHEEVLDFPVAAEAPTGPDDPEVRAEPTTATARPDAAGIRPELIAPL